MRRLIILILKLRSLDSSSGYSPMSPSTLERWGKRQPQLIQLFGRRRSAVGNPKALVEQYIRFGDCFGMSSAGVFMMPVWTAALVAVLALIGGTILVGQYVDPSKASTAGLVGSEGVIILLMVALGAVGGFLAGQFFVVRKIHKTIYADTHAGSFLDGFHPGMLTELGRVKLYRGAFAARPDFFHGGSRTSGVLGGYLRMKAPPGKTVERSTLAELLNDYLPISEADWRKSTLEPEDAELAELENGGQIDGFHGASASDARALKQRLIKTGQLENQVSKPKWKRYNDFIFWVFCGLVVVACIFQSVSGYSLTFDPSSLAEMMPF